MGNIHLLNSAHVTNNHQRNNLKIYILLLRTLLNVETAHKHTYNENYVSNKIFKPKTNEYFIDWIWLVPSGGQWSNHSMKWTFENEDKKYTACRFETTRETERKRESDRRSEIPTNSSAKHTQRGDHITQISKIRRLTSRETHTENSRARACILIVRGISSDPPSS